ncbi:MAG: HIT domain-containing protein [Candidatus Omnitrophica bacterium]|nr:HIT domain-containing protein [Candidatus Omnitrophota bacterium]MDD5352289.1 HIT domain-containing protein [Candidatus Omnitrophota bacterium]MDD5549887.1 HIT domain-containing protein [Candidatus Omnitrophota bacterium]
MNKIWAPWRIKYIRKPENKKCVLCLPSKNKAIDKKRFVILRGKHSFSVLNIYPYNNGHFMACPVKHIKKLEELKQAEILDLFDVIKKTIKLVDKALKPKGYNLGINLGKVSGAGIDKHLHIHVVPRWNGDTNFMPIISNTKVISQSLKDLYKRLVKVK